MSTGTADFFGSRQGAALMKHTLLKAYIHLFVNKLGSTHEQVYYLDGYAGPGVYDDGTEGSPKLAIQIADLVEEIRDLRCIFVEKNPASANALAQLIENELPDGRVIQGGLEDHVESVIELSNNHPLLAFIDPFGLGLPFDQLQQLGNRANLKTDIIMNVSLSALRRVGGQLTAKGTDATYLKARESMLDRMDSVLGGPWWRPLWEDAKRSGATDGAERIAYGYADRCKAVRGGYFIAEVKDRWDGPPAYCLLLLASHGDAFWNFNEFMSLGYDRLREEDPQDQLLDVTGDYPAVLERNLRRLIAEKKEFVVGNELNDVYGSLLGAARTTHLRPVIKKLCKESVLATSSKNAKGKLVGDGQGDMQHMTVSRA